VFLRSLYSIPGYNPFIILIQPGIQPILNSHLTQDTIHSSVSSILFIIRIHPIHPSNPTHSSFSSNQFIILIQSIHPSLPTYSTFLSNPFILLIQPIHPSYPTPHWDLCCISVLGRICTRL